MTRISWHFLAETHRLDARRRDAGREQKASSSLGTPFSETTIVFGRASLVSKTCKNNVIAGMFHVPLTTIVAAEASPGDKAPECSRSFLSTFNAAKPAAPLISFVSTMTEVPLRTVMIGPDASSPVRLNADAREWANELFTRKAATG
jgi:hypothetical protein